MRIDPSKPGGPNPDLHLPLSGSVSAGFPSPAQDYADVSLDLNKELIRNPSSTFFARVSGHSMQGAGIEDGDLLVIDKSLTPSDGDIAVCFLDGEFTLKRIQRDKKGLTLLPAHPDYPPIPVTDDNHFVLWGIVTYSIKDHKRKK